MNLDSDLQELWRSDPVPGKGRESPCAFIARALAATTSPQLRPGPHPGADSMTPWEERRDRNPALNCRFPEGKGRDAECQGVTGG